MNALFKSYILFCVICIFGSNVNAQIVDKLFINQRYLDSIQIHQSVYDVHEHSPILLGIIPNYNQDKNLVLNAFSAHEGGIEEVFTQIANPKLYEWENDDYQCYFTVNGVVEDRETGVVSEYVQYSSLETAVRLQFSHGNFRDQKGKEYFFDSRTGMCSGINGMTYYEIMYDFGLGFEFDTMVFYENENGGNLQGKLYRFEVIDTGVLHLFEIIPDWEKFNHKISVKPLILKKY